MMKESPTFYHAPVLLAESLDALAIRPDGIYVDATMGGAGHTRGILERLGPAGRLMAFDHDRDAWANAPTDDVRFTLVTENFRYIRRFLRLHGVPAVDGILADLGVSSHQFDTGARGFSTRFDGPLDMRMDHRLERTAADVLREASEPELHALFEQYGEVRNSRQLARHIAASRKGTPLSTIADLKALAGPVVKGQPQRYWAQVFQALRIEVNGELDALKEFLEAVPGCLKPGGRLAVISFHSLEDRLVKTFIRRGRFTEDPAAALYPGPDPLPPLRAVHPKPIEAGDGELTANPRARSAKLRVAERIQEKFQAENSEFQAPRH